MLLVIAACLLGFGCPEGRTTYSMEARSPDGLWLATAPQSAVGGPGTAYDGTTVYLKRKGPQPPWLVLAFSHQYATMISR
jgi:hypothetical protein